MHERFDIFVATGVDVLTLVAGFLLFTGFVRASAKWLSQALSKGPAAALGTYRRKLSRTVLIGLELLLAATILETIIIPSTIQALGIILATVVIRTALGWTTSLEAYGRWPWQRG